LLPPHGDHGLSNRHKKAISILLNAIAYVVAFTAAVLVVKAVSAVHPLLAIGLGDLAGTAVIFVSSVLADNSSMYDPYWSVAPVAIVFYYWWSHSPHLEARQLLAGCLLLVYAIRLTANFYRGWPGLDKEDFRYVALRGRAGRLYWPVSLLGIHLFPTAMVYLACLPLYGVMTPDGPRLGPLDIVAALVMVGAVALAFAADEQLRAFKNDPARREQSIQTGLWKFSRHPNYLGEITTWWGLYLFALAAGARWWWSGVGAVAVTLMFVFVSVPMMERRALATRAEYEAYRRHTSMLLPLGFDRARKGSRQPER
jgi:steroid 5-alpha reductase family enzyme